MPPFWKNSEQYSLFLFKAMQLHCVILGLNQICYRQDDLAEDRGRKPNRWQVSLFEQNLCANICKRSGQVVLDSLDLLSPLKLFHSARSRSINLILTRSQIASPHTRRETSRELGGGWMFSGGWRESFWGCYPGTRMRAPSQRPGFARRSPSGRDVEPPLHPRDKKGARAATHGLTAGIQPLPRWEGKDVISRSTHQNNTLQSSETGRATWFLAATLENVKHFGGTLNLISTPRGGTRAQGNRDAERDTLRQKVPNPLRDLHSCTLDLDKHDWLGSLLNLNHIFSI